MDMTFSTLGQMWEYAVRLCLHSGIKVAGTRELLGTHLTLSNPQSLVIYNAVRKASVGYLGAELAWYLSGSDSLEHIARYAPSYGKFSDDGETAYGAYGIRGLALDSLMKLAARIKENPESRQHVILIWREGDIGSGSKDVPCTVSLHFLLREDRLNLSVYMRSNDLYKGFMYDIPCFCLILQLVASMIGCRLGVYHHHVGSLHIYDRDATKLLEAMSRVTCTHHWSSFGISDARKLMNCFTGGDGIQSSNSQLQHVLNKMEELRDSH